MWYDESQWSNELFKDYIRDFMKVKAEGTGWPDDCVTDVQRAEFLAKYKERIGVDLDIGELDKANAGFREIAKLFLNSVSCVCMLFVITFRCGVAGD